MTKKRALWGSAMAVVLVAGCAVGPEYETPKPNIPGLWANGKSEPSSVQPVSDGSTTVAREALAVWWTRMGDPLLDDLVRQAVEGNLDVASAKARIRETRAARDKAVGGLWPSGGGTGSLSKAKTGTAPSTTNFSLGLQSSWELDLFGANRRAVEGAERAAEAAEWDLRATLLTLIGDVVQSYVDAREAQARLTLSRETSVAQGRTADLTRILVQAGSSTAVDLRKAEATAISAEADALAHETDFAKAAHRLAVLLGKDPEALIVTLTEPRPIPFPTKPLPAGIPAEVLSVHPTVQKAERELAKATTAIGAAEADRYPSVSLTGSLSTSAVRAGDLFSASSISWAIGPSISLPLFNQGELAAAVTGAEAQRDQALIAYRQAVLTALEDVENALVALSREKSRLESLRQVAVAYRDSAVLSRDLYQAGTASFLDVLDAERSLYSAQDAVLQSEAAVAADHIALAKALGGGWDGAVESAKPEVVDENTGPHFAFPL
jgi:NodT family efflux transporter outer membrane factor (OMF) lipoprotein